ncbi:hypothetical protein SAMN05660489_05572 [Pseudomonas sp. LAMO17WK12:I10]|uniref:hypothetical protein n=1 Tax=unclassified Pseudomonas TaxID=196821 RepID=UPI000BC7C71B|nr:MULTISPECIES: hypothetical protein [unclassified Pseudomonas]PXX55657.1 hypothetical protein H160_05494 [Pseudomonas sp. LAMO17WK12:I9]SNY50868.1 hypothetical protein SAMN05660489_05572 [Pseudomonas sp. LAMO17WK12:I10]
MSAIEDYCAALQRLIEGKTFSVPKGSAINKDTVALEAGRKRGSIKKSREEHTQLIAKIEAAATAQHEQAKPTPAQEAEKQKALKKAAQVKLGSLKEDYELALTKIVSLVHENHMLKEQIKKLTEELTEEMRRNNKVVRMSDASKRS